MVGVESALRQAQSRSSALRKRNRLVVVDQKPVDEADRESGIKRRYVFQPGRRHQE
jgi:hypothetical protein